MNTKVWTICAASLALLASYAAAEPSGADVQPKQVKVSWDVNDQGHVSNCKVTESSGDKELDDAACKLVVERWNAKPLRDKRGKKADSPK